MASASPPSSTPVADSAEADANKGSEEESSIKDEQWKAMRRVIDNLYAYRQSE